MEKSARNNPLPPFHVLIAAAGQGSRLGGDIPKQYKKLAGKPVLRHTLETFLSIPELASLHVIINPADRELYEEAVKGLSLSPPIAGGDTRKESIYKGLLGISKVNNEDIILFHDAARPFISPEDIRKLAGTVAETGAASLALPIADTLFRPGRECGRETSRYIDRQGLYSLQTPQGFYYDLILKAHKGLAGEEFTDDTGLVTAAGYAVRLVEGSRTNFKITTADDWDLAEKIMESDMKEQTRTGTGFDVHAFDEEPGIAIRLCGIDIPHTSKLKGHSDADVGLHAITDALLGAMAEGDIGDHFPPTDVQWKDKDSAFFLRHAVELLGNKEGIIHNIDLTLICETPKIGPYKKKMRERVAAICGLLPEQVSIKATTTEGLGFTGRGEGIAAQAAVSINLPFHSQLKGAKDA